MCNLFSVTASQEEIRRFFGVVQDSTGNLQPQMGVFPDTMAPIVRNTPAGRELATVRWGLPSSSQALFEAATRRADRLRAKGQDPDFKELLRMEPDGGTTNVRNIKSKHWTRWFGVENRCLVPFNSFCEPDQASGSKENTWFALGEDRPLAFFAGIWVPAWESVRKIKEGLVTCDLFGFHTCDANDEVKAIHPKAMPVILTKPEELELWMTAPAAEALTLRRPLPNGSLKIVARGSKYDGIAA